MKELVLPKLLLFNTDLIVRIVLVLLIEFGEVIVAAVLWYNFIVEEQLVIFLDDPERADFGFVQSTVNNIVDLYWLIIGLDLDLIVEILVDNLLLDRLASLVRGFALTAILALVDLIVLHLLLQKLDLVLI